MGSDSGPEGNEEGRGDEEGEEEEEREEEEEGGTGVGCTEEEVGTGTFGVLEEETPVEQEVLVTGGATG